MKIKKHIEGWLVARKLRYTLLLLVAAICMAGLPSCASRRAIDCPDTGSAQIIGVDKKGRATRESKTTRKTKDGLLKKNKSQKKARR